jgi:hypothetical protein
MVTTGENTRLYNLTILDTNFGICVRHISLEHNNITLLDEFILTTLTSLDHIDCCDNLQQYDEVVEIFVHVEQFSVCYHDVTLMITSSPNAA